MIRNHAWVVSTESINSDILWLRVAWADANEQVGRLYLNANECEGHQFW